MGGLLPRMRCSISDTVVVAAISRSSHPLHPGLGLDHLADALDEELSSGARRVVLDNTYLTRAARSHVLEVAQEQKLDHICRKLQLQPGETRESVPPGELVEFAETSTIFTNPSDSRTEEYVTGKFG